MIITFTKYDKKQGITCDNCGRYIENVYQIEIDNKIWNVGSECFKKLEEKTDLSQFGKKWLKKEINKMLKYQMELKILESEDTKKIDKCFPGIALAEQSEGEYYISRKDSIKKLLWITPIRIKDIEDEIEKKTKNIKLKDME